MFAAVFLRLGWEDGIDYLQSHQVAILISWGVFMLALGIGGLYESDQLNRLGRTLTAASISVLIGTALITTIFYATLSLKIGRGIFVAFAVLVLMTVVSMRLIFRLISGMGFLTQRSLIIGTNGEARNVIRLVRQFAHSDVKIVGLVRCGPEGSHVGSLVDGVPVLGDADSLEKLAKLHQIERLILAAPDELDPGLMKRLRSFRYRGLGLSDYVSLHEELTHEISLEHINEEWLFAASMNTSRFHTRRLKRVTDIMAAVVGLVLSAPIMAVAAVLIKLDSRGPVLYRQERMGRDSAPFMIFKFRTMYEDAESRTGPVWATEDDPRITRVGKWLRKFRIDELPQLANVLSGEMSMVGPRPEREIFVKELSRKLPFYAERLLVSPGLTGWAQVMLPYAASIEESRRKLQADLYYIKHMSLTTDILIILKTVKIVLFGRERAPQPKAAESAAASTRQSTALLQDDAALAKQSQLAEVSRD